MSVSVFGEHFGANLRRIRKERRLTQEALGRIVGYSGGNINNYEHGRYVPRLITVQRFAARLGVTVEDLIKDENGRSRVILDGPTFDRGMRAAIEEANRHLTAEARGERDNRGRIG